MCNKYISLLFVEISHVPLVKTTGVNPILVSTVAFVRKTSISFYAIVKVPVTRAPSATSVSIAVD